MKLAFKRKYLTDEKVLIDACIAEDRQAQNKLFDTYAPRMLGVCFRYASNREEAEDIMQDAFVKVFNNLAKFRAESSLETWMTRIMVNASLNYLRSARRLRLESDIEVVSNDLSWSSSQAHQMDTRVLMEHIQALPDGYRVVLNMYAIEGYSHKEIGDMLGIGESSSRSQLARAKGLLHKKLLTSGLNQDKRYAGE